MEGGSKSMSKVDNRIVEMGFENKSFEKNLKDSQTSLGNFDKSLQNMAKNTTSFSALGGVVQGIGGKFTALGTVVTGALLKIGAVGAAVGIQLAKSLSLDQITAGFGEYELKLNSIKIMLAGALDESGNPVTLEMVNQELAELNEYADQTIYSFADMTSNITKFTNQGISLHDSVQAIKGISNAAALSGANTNEASRAMYNFGQALSAGYIRVIDWKSIELANMATVEFKTQLLEGAVAAGTLEKRADGMYNVLTDGGSDYPIDATHHFNDTLEKQWLTTDALTSVLINYADSTTAIGAKATEAATKVRTFSQLMQTTKEGIGSGWAVTFENIFGNFEEATALWSGVSDAIKNITQANADARNAVLKGWKDLGGRDDLLLGLSTAWNNIYSIIHPLMKEFKKFLNIDYSKTLYTMTKAFKDFMVALTPAPSTLKKLGVILRAVFSALSFGWDIVSGVFGGLVKGVKSIIDLIPAGKERKIGILSFFVNLTNSFTAWITAVQKAGKIKDISNTIAEGIENIAKNVIKFVDAIKSSKLLNDILLSLGEGFAWFGNSIKKLYNLLKESEFIPTILEKIKSAFYGFKKVDTSGVMKVHGKLAKISTLKYDLAPFVDGLKELFNTIKEFLGKAWSTASFDGFIDILLALITGKIGLEIVKFVKSITGISDSLGGFGKGFLGIMGGLEKVFTSYAKNIDAKTLQTIAIAVLILVGALAVLTLLDQDKLATAVVTITSLFINLSVSMKALKRAGGATKLAGEMIMIAAAVLILSFALKNMKDVDQDAILALSIVLGELYLIASGFGRMKNANTSVANLMGLSASVLILSHAVKVFGSMDPDQLGKGLVAISAILASLMIFSIGISKGTKDGGSLMKAAAAMMILGIAMLSFARVVQVFGSMDEDSLKKGFAAISAILMSLMIFSIAISKGTKEGASLIAAAAAMMILGLAMLQFAGVIAVFGNFEPTALVQGIEALGGVLLLTSVALIAMADPKILAGAAAMLIAAIAISTFIPVVLALGNLPMDVILTALIAIGSLFLVVAVGAFALKPTIGVISAFSAALLVVGLGALAAGAGMLLFTTGLAMLAAGGAGAVAVLALTITTLASLLPMIMQKVGEGFVALVQTLAANAPVLMESFGVLLQGLIDVIVQKVPDFVVAGILLILGILQGIADNVQQVVEVIVQMVINILDGLTEKLPDLITAGADLIIAYLDGMGTEIPRVVDSGLTMVIDFINGIADSIRENTPLMLEAVANLATAFIDGVKDYLNLDEGSSIARDMIDGLIEGVTNGIDLVLKAVTDLGEAVISAIKAILGIESPSKFTREMGEYLDLGLVQGLIRGSKNVVGAAKRVGETSVDALRSAMKKISDVVDYEINSSPVITPVLNLNGLRSSANNLNNLLSMGKSYDLAISKIGDDRALSIENQNGSNPLSDPTQIIKNEFNLNGITIRSDADITKLAEELYRRQENAMRSRGIRPAYSN